MSAGPERFFKYHGLGNDFVLLDRRETAVDIDTDEARALCDRHRGIGADGVLVLLPSSRAAARMVVHNADGGIPEMCGNGLRCAVKYLVARVSPPPSTLDVETGAGVLRCRVHHPGEASEAIEIDMGPARWVADNLPSADGSPFIEAELPDAPSRRGTAVSLGNPHLVLFDAPLEEAGTLGPELEHAHGFPERTNVEWVEPEDGAFRVVVWERGVGLTQACGTGACAVAAAAVRTGRAESGSWIRVLLPGGALEVRVAADYGSVELRGDARFVFEGVVRSPGAR